MIDRTAIFSCVFVALGVFRRRSSHIFITDSRAWDITGSESSLLLFICFTLSSILHLCHWAYQYLLLFCSNKFIRVCIRSQCVFLWFQVLALRSDKEEKREREKKKERGEHLCPIDFRRGSLVILSSDIWRKLFRGPKRLRCLAVYACTWDYVWVNTEIIVRATWWMSAVAQYWACTSSVILPTLFTL